MYARPVVGVVDDVDAVSQAELRGVRIAAVEVAAVLTHVPCHDLQRDVHAVGDVANDDGVLALLDVYARDTSYLVVELARSIPEVGIILRRVVALVGCSAILRRILPLQHLVCQRLHEGVGEGLDVVHRDAGLQGCVEVVGEDAVLVIGGRPDAELHLGAACEVALPLVHLELYAFGIQDGLRGFYHLRRPIACPCVCPHALVPTLALQLHEHFDALEVAVACAVLSRNVVYVVNLLDIAEVEGDDGGILLRHDELVAAVCRVPECAVVAVAHAASGIATVRGVRRR